MKLTSLAVATSALAVGCHAAPGPLTISLTLRSAALDPGRSSKTGLRAKRDASPANVPLTDWMATPATVDLQWYGTISVGTPAQEFTVLFDTGSADLILARSNCTNCLNQRRFDSSKSTSFSPAPGLQELIPFGTGANAVPLGEPQNASGLVATDTVALAGLVVPKQAFLLQDTVAAAFNQMPIDGILGLPPIPHSNFAPGGDAKRTPPLYWQLSDAGQLASPVFSFLLNSGNSGPGQGGELTIGGIDDSKHNGAITYIGLNETLVQTFAEWLIGAPEMAVDGKTILQNPLSVALLDTGTAYILAPDMDTTKALYAAISPEIRQIDPNGAWGASCDVMEKLEPELNFVVADSNGNKISLQVDKKSFNLGEYPGQAGICQAVVLNPVPPIDVGVPFWTIGSPLLKSYYTVWDGPGMRIGFANPKRSSGDEDTDGNGFDDGDAPFDDLGVVHRPAALTVGVVAAMAAVAALV